MLHSSACEGSDGLAAMNAVLRTYMKGDGMAIQFNVFNTETLYDAKEHPEKYKNLQVRICGWNVLWNNLSRAEQEAFILRCENIA
jgi:formate C-acetyltransferase